MIHIDVRVVSLKDLPPWPNIKPMTLGEISHAGVLEHGMRSGETSIYFLVQTPKGVVAAETSLKLLNMVCSIANGADKRFKDKPERN